MSREDLSFHHVNLIIYGNLPKMQVFFPPSAFTLRKENLETLEAISYMAAVLGVLPSDFTYAGTKDKRAITYQAMVVKKISPER